MTISIRHRSRDQFGVSMLCPGPRVPRPCRGTTVQSALRLLQLPYSPGQSSRQCLPLRSCRHEGGQRRMRAHLSNLVPTHRARRFDVLARLGRGQAGFLVR